MILEEGGVFTRKGHQDICTNWQPCYKHCTDSSCTIKEIELAAFFLFTIFMLISEGILGTDVLLGLRKCAVDATRRANENVEKRAVKDVGGFICLLS